MSACAAGSFDPCNPPPWPIAGPAVAEELEGLEKENPACCAALSEWLARLEKLHDQLEAAQ